MRQSAARWSVTIVAVGLGLGVGTVGYLGSPGCSVSGLGSLFALRRGV